MRFDEYQVFARRTQNHELTGDERIQHALCGLSSEVGEIASIYQKRFQGHPVDEATVADEMGDVLWFLSELADCLCVHLGSVAQHNVSKLLKRYPDGFDSDRSVNREEYRPHDNA